MITLKTKYFKYCISNEAQNLAFEALKGKNNKIIKGPCAFIVQQDHSEIPAVSATYINHLLFLKFADDTTVEILVEELDEYITFTIKNVSRFDFLSIAFVNIKVRNNSNFYATLIGMTLSTRMLEHPGNNKLLRAEAYPHIGILSTKHSPYPCKCAFFGAPKNLVNQIERRIVDNIPDNEVPKSSKGGPYANSVSEIASENYTIFMETTTMDNIHEIIAKLKSFAITQVNIHHFGHYTQGDFKCYKEFYPNGISDLKKVVDCFHENGFLVGIHTYSFFVDPKSSYVSPIPHKDLDTIREFTLAEDLNINSTTLSVYENTDSLNSTDQYLVINSPYLWVDNEIIKFESASNGKVNGIIRGAYGTTPAQHKKGAIVKQLKQYFNIPVAKAHSPLFYEIARNTADFYNKLDADMLLLDALDGAHILEGNDYVWYHAVDFMREMFSHIKKAPIFNCCHNPQYTGSWFARTRYGAIDSPYIAPFAATDAHANYNKKMSISMGVSPEFGWLDLYPKLSFSNKEWLVDSIFAEEMEYICAKAFGSNASVSLLENYKKFYHLPCTKTYASIMYKYAEYKKEHPLVKTTQKWLSQSRNSAFLKNDNLYKAKYPYVFIEHSGDYVEFSNSFSSQYPNFRIEALYSAEDYNHPSSINLCELNENQPISSKTYKFSKPIDFKGNKGIGVWCYGDESGAIVQIALHNIRNNTHKVGEHYIRVNFKGWKYFAFYENQNSYMTQYGWEEVSLMHKDYDDLQNSYGKLRPTLSYNELDAISIKVKGSKNIMLRTIKLLPHKSTVWESPTLVLNDSRMILHDNLNSGEVLHFSNGHLVISDYLGNILREPTFDGKLEALQGINSFSILSNNNECHLRAKATFSLIGEKLQ